MQNEKNPHAVALGKMGGKKRQYILTEEQREAARRNGRLSKGPNNPHRKPRHNILTDKEHKAISSGARVIPLTKGQWAIVDEADYEKVSALTWQAHQGRNTYYARHNSMKDGKPTSIFLHRFLVGEGTNIDHKDGDGLNNRRENLRPASGLQNCYNSKKRSHNSTGYKGVKHSNAAGRFCASITVNRKVIHLGSFASAELAHAAYVAAAHLHHGEFARTA